ncbi:hypothetical protein Tco_0931911 [Tanacetum coccineum]
MDDPNITMEEYIRLEEEKSHRRGKVFNWETATYGKIWNNEDVHNLGSVETEFPAIVFNETLISEEALSCEPMAYLVALINNSLLPSHLMLTSGFNANYEEPYDRLSIPDFRQLYACLVLVGYRLLVKVRKVPTLSHSSSLRLVYYSNRDVIDLMF